MRTAKRLTILLIVAVIGINEATVRSGQDNASAQISNTRTADCLVKITADPGVMPLNRETLEGLLHSSAVQGKAMTEVLGPGTVEDRHEFIFVDWLSGSGYSKGTQASRSSAEQEMLRQLEDVYGREYAGMMAGQQRTPDDKPEPGDASQADDRSAPKNPTKRNSPRSDTMSGGSTGGYGGGGGMMGGMGGSMGGGMMGGMGGMSGGGFSGGMGAGTIEPGRLYGGWLPDGPYGPVYGGMMGGMGGGFGSMGGFYGTPAGSKDTSAVESSVVIRLMVEFPDEFKPVAKEFLSALVVNLRNNLVDAHERHVDGLKEVLASAKSQREQAEQNVQGGGAATSDSAMRIKEQLDTLVDLSALSAQMPVGEAIEVLKNAVQPPLQIVALWKDLQEGANVEPSTPIDIDGMSSVRLGTAIDLLAKGISDPLPGAPAVVYRIKDNVIVIGTSTALGMPSMSATGAKIQVDIRALAGQRDELARAIQSLELNQVSMEARRKAMYVQMEEARQQADKRLAADTVTQELEKLVQISTTHLELLQQRVAAGQTTQADLASAQESVARARIELARRREELSKLTGGGRIEQYDSELSKMAIDEAESRARLDVLRKQLADVQGQLTQASTFDPEAARMRIAQETLDLTNRRVGELETRLASLQPPTVTIIGVN